MICYEIRLSEFPEMQIFLNIYACIWINISPSISHDDEKNIRGIIRYDDYALSFAEPRRRQINDTISSSSLNIQNDTNIIYRQNYPSRLSISVTRVTCHTACHAGRHWPRDTMEMHCDVKMVSLNRVTVTKFLFKLRNRG